jgi:3-oxoadipate enol-lactonase
MRPAATVELVHDVQGPAGAPWLLLGPSLGSTRQMWDGVLPALAERFRVVRYEHRGHGGSPVVAGPYRIDELGGDVLALADRLGAQRFAVAGLSLGGMVGMWLAAQAPQRVDRLALLCTSAHLPPAQAWRDRAAAVRSGGTAAVADAVVARWFTPAWAAEHPARVAAATAMLRGVPAHGYAGCCEAVAALDLRAELPRITAATLVIAGDDDVATPPAHARLIAGLIPGSRLEVLDGVAHLAAYQEPDACARLILQHLTDHQEA